MNIKNSGFKFKDWECDYNIRAESLRLLWWWRWWRWHNGCFFSICHFFSSSHHYYWGFFYCLFEYRIGFQIPIGIDNNLLRVIPMAYIMLRWIVWWRQFYLENFFFKISCKSSLNSFFSSAKKTINFPVKIENHDYHLYTSLLVNSFSVIYSFIHFSLFVSFGLIFC